MLANILSQTYGATGSGKTYTMSGTMYEEGVLPRAIREVFDSVESIKFQYMKAVFVVEMSYCELYNNSFRNLLRNGNGDSGGNGTEEDGHLYYPGLACHYNDKIEVHETPKTGVFLSGCPKFQVEGAEDAIGMIRRGDKSRSARFE